MNRRVLLLVALVAVLVGAVFSQRLVDGDSSPDSSSSVETPAEDLDSPIDRAQQTALEFGDRSHWLQPWRAYLDTVPATRLREAVGININNTVAPEDVPALARLLSANGFTRARYEIGWGSIDYETGELENAASVRKTLAALKRYRIRPLILLNAHHGRPCPTRPLDVRVATAAKRGARRIRLDAATAKQVAPRRSGINAPDGRAAEVLFTAVAPDGTATLSKPLPRDLAAGSHPGSTLRYAPFAPPQRPDGKANPAFERTLDGWLRYVDTVTGDAREVLGDGNFDVEIWNELTFGSDFLYSDRYYEPAASGKGDPTLTIAARTVDWLRDPGSGLSSEVGVTNGFESQRPWASGESSPPGLTAISKHPYKKIRRFPQDAANDAPGIRPLDALGRPAGTLDKKTNRWKDDFVPTYDAFFPEYYLNAIQTEHLIRDLSPITTDLNGTDHGRSTHPPGSDAPTMWITETNLDPTGADPSKPSESGSGPLTTLTGRDRDVLQAKVVLRYLTSFVNKGVGAIYFYAARDRVFGLVDESFFAAAGAGRYPGNGSGGETTGAVRRLVASLRGARDLSETKPVSLLDVSDDHDRRQFAGDGSAAHPPLYDRDVVGFFPYQIDEDSYLIPAYVMTRSLAKPYRPARFRLTVKIPGMSGITARATDPLLDASVPVKVVSQNSDRLVLELELTDSPRLVTLDVR